MFFLKKRDVTRVAAMGGMYPGWETVIEKFLGKKQLYAISDLDAGTLRLITRSWTKIKSGK